MERKKQIQLVILNLIQDLQRLPLLLLNNMRGRFQIKFGMTSLYNNGGFTLIELLVVVLIIGILAAVAVPQYQKAVMKSRLATVKPMLAAIKSAQEVYYLNNGRYATSINILDITLNCPQGIDESVFYCDKYFTVDILSYSYSTPSLARMRAYYCPKNIGLSSCARHADFEYDIYYANTQYPNQAECIGYTDLGKKACHGE